MSTVFSIAGASSYAHGVGIVTEIKHGKQYKITDTLNFEDVCQSVAKIKFVE